MGGPAETMIGVGALGIGTVLVVAAFKNVSPLALIRNAITEGDLDLSELPKIDPGEPDGLLPMTPGDLPAQIDAIIAKVQAKDPQLATDLQSTLASLSPGVAETQAPLARKYADAAVGRGYITAVDRAVLEAEIVKRST